MTKKDYIALAGAIRFATSSEITNSVVKSKFIEALCQRFEEENPRFNRKKFEEACRCPAMDKVKQ